MRTIQLIPGKNSSALGFGCAPILGAVDASTARRAIDCALDCGITHFDVARSYGYGDAERFLGRTLGRRRDQVLIASKFGIRATQLARILAPLKPLVRRFRPPGKIAPGAPVATGPSVADRFHRRIPLSPKAMSESLDESLKNLGTDHLDAFFVHEPPGPLIELDALCEKAAEWKKAGKIRAWGLAIGGGSLEIHRPTLSRFDVLQIDNHPGAAHYPELLANRGLEANAFFSPLRGSAREGLAPAEILQRLAADFPRSVILCSMFHEGHIRANAAALAA